jgi:hypothetical protein
MACAGNCGHLHSVPTQLRNSSMLSAAIDFWLLPVTLFFDAFLPASKPAAEIIPFTPAAQRIRRKRKVIRSKRGY